MKEFEFIQWIRSQTKLDPIAVPVGPGDDCAIVMCGAEKLLITVDQLPPAVLREACGRIGPDVGKHLGAANVVKRYAPAGAGGAKQVREQLRFWKKQLAESTIA